MRIPSRRRAIHVGETGAVMISGARPRSDPGGRARGRNPSRPTNAGISVHLDGNARHPRGFSSSSPCRFRRHALRRVPPLSGPSSIAGPLVNTRIATTEFKANVLSVNRQKWIDTLRDLIATLDSQVLIAGGAPPDPGGANRYGHCPGSRAAQARGELAADGSQDRAYAQSAGAHQQLNVLMKEGIG